MFFCNKLKTPNSVRGQLKSISQIAPKPTQWRSLLHPCPSACPLALFSSARSDYLTADAWTFEIRLNRVSKVPMSRPNAGWSQPLGESRTKLAADTVFPAGPWIRNVASTCRKYHNSGNAIFAFLLCALFSLTFFPANLVVAAALALWLWQIRLPSQHWHRNRSLTWANWRASTIHCPLHLELFISGLFAPEGIDIISFSELNLAACFPVIHCLETRKSLRTSVKNDPRRTKYWTLGWIRLRNSALISGDAKFSNWYCLWL